MNSDKHVADIERMAHSVGMLPARGNVLTCGNRDGVTLDALTRFAALVRADERQRWESKIGPLMPADFKDWHQNSPEERPDVAAWVIANQRSNLVMIERHARAQALEEAARKADHYAALLDGIAAGNFRNCAAAIRALGDAK